MSDNDRMTAQCADEILMQRALTLAGQAMYITSPNPRVGCVIADAQGRILGEGHTQVAGQAHAEVMALKSAQQHGHSVSGATAYVTLEPCSHQGRTGPCCEALAQAGLARVVVAVQDPNPLVRGAGIAHLRAQGIQVDMGLLANEAIELNVGFFQRMTLGRPWVRMKIAASLDGQTALPNGVSQWITGEAARADGHAWRTAR
jgi:diaminohydroxyphosphoribosylaminopyrimidine deaminase/5-amino-6-(5-phosphoribosylamino)uracil reductase